MSEEEQGVKLGRYIQSIRKQKGMTQEELALKLDVARTTIVGIEKGTRPLKYDELKILEGLGFIDIFKNMDALPPVNAIEGVTILTDDERKLLLAYRNNKFKQLVRMALEKKDAEE